MKDISEHEHKEGQKSESTTFVAVVIYARPG